MEPRKFNGYPKTDTGKQSNLNFPLLTTSPCTYYSLNLEKLHPPAREVLERVPNVDHLLRVPTYSDSLVFLTKISQVFILEKLGWGQSDGSAGKAL